MKGTAQSNLIGGWEIDLETSGLSRRDYFAAMAMQGYCANPSAWEHIAGCAQRPSNGSFTEILADMAVTAGDALIAELSKEERR